MNYEQIRAAVREAVGGALPTSPDDGTVVVHFDHEGVPTWSSPTGVVEAITTAVMQALYPAPASLPEVGEPVRVDPLVAGKWTCGCDSSQCKIVWSVGRDSSADPSQVIRATCQTHAISGDSMSARCSANQGMRQQAQALYNLDTLHGEQCR